MVTYFRRLVPVTLLLASAAGAQPFQDLAVLDAWVAAALGARAGEPGGAIRPIDRRLKLAACPEEAEVTPPVLGAATVRCISVGWRIAVPVIAAARPAKAEPIVRKGDQVELAVVSDGFMVSAVAVAEQDGAAGDRIRVRTAQKSAPVMGTISEDGRVVLHGFK
ncbi:MAG: flagella basal body P-ring formation protein FlgA [Sphingomonadales bacterium]